MERLIFKNEYPEYEVLKYVCPRMQSYCSYILENVPKGIKKIILFGSSLTTACTSFSDLDLIVILENKESTKMLHDYLGAIDIEVDAVTIFEEEIEEFFENNKNLRRALNERSIVLYEC